MNKVSAANIYICGRPFYADMQLNINLTVHIIQSKIINII